MATNSTSRVRYGMLTVVAVGRNMCNQAVDPHFIFSGACEQLTEPIHPSRQNRHGSSPSLRAMIAVRASEEKCNHRKSAHRCGSVNSSPFTTLRSGECSLISASATGSPSGDEKGSRVERPRCPCNCKRRAIQPSRHWNQRFREGGRKASTREPGDLPDAVVLRPDRVCRTNGDILAERQSSPCRRGRAGESCRLPDAGQSSPARFPTGHMPSGLEDMI